MCANNLNHRIKSVLAEKQLSCKWFAQQMENQRRLFADVHQIKFSPL